MNAVCHRPVLLSETLQAIGPRSGCVYADATLGQGGHTQALLEASAPDGRVIALDRDATALESARRRLAVFGARALLVHARFSQLERLLHERGVSKLDGLVADLGVSSDQLDRAERGFSFARSGPLDMRMDQAQGKTARELIEELPESELADVLFALGQERRSRAIAASAKRAVRAGELSTTEELRKAVVRVLGPARRGRVNPATRTFQALRIAVNRELSELDALLRLLPDVLHEGAVAVLICFHSLEDRRVKQALRADPRLVPLFKKPLRASREEQAHNPRARSARARAARRVANGPAA
ncbi:MAG: 16S rRNA (cytosine(1402)-N(4))-methyltransferase RsmH [Proteobacteria bacterium]|nr:16S rRNA (cytosine(1402)-N(4))-methyltransferase RsmH [Pseudomonadota bacterium]